MELSQKLKAIGYRLDKQQKEIFNQVVLRAAENFYFDLKVTTPDRSLYLAESLEYQQQLQARFEASTQG
jgi:hypothetical protein